MHSRNRRKSPGHAKKKISSFSNFFLIPFCFLFLFFARSFPMQVLVPILVVAIQAFPVSSIIFKQRDEPNNRFLYAQCEITSIIKNVNWKFCEQHTIKKKNKKLRHFLLFIPIKFHNIYRLFFCWFFFSIFYFIFLRPHQFQTPQIGFDFVKLGKFQVKCFISIYKLCWCHL